MRAVAVEQLESLRSDAVAAARAGSLGGWGASHKPLADALAPHILTMAQDGAREALYQVRDVMRPDEAQKLCKKAGRPPKWLLGLLEQANEEAVEWAEDNAGELIKGVEQTTKDGVKKLVAQALELGWTNDELADELMAAPEFGEARADLIATTETAMADVQGSLIGWRESGVVTGRTWVMGTDNIDVCEECQAMNGVTVGIGEDFDDGDPPLHPRCRCDVVPVVADEE